MKLDQFLKWKNLVSSGGEAKIFIKSGSVKVNGVIETRRVVGARWVTFITCSWFIKFCRI